MTQKYSSHQFISISASESGTEIELKMVVDFTVHPGSNATLVDPAEGPLAEMDFVRFFLVKDGKPSKQPVSIPGWLSDHFIEGSAFQEWMLSEAAEQHVTAQEDHADQRREMMREAFDV